MFHTKFVEKIKTHVLCSATISENHPVYEIVWKNTVTQTGHGWKYTTAQGHCMLDN